MVFRMCDIRQWLHYLGLDQYAGAFEKSAIAWNHLADLDHAILKEIGVSVVGHRMTILKAVRDLGSKARSERSQLLHGESTPGKPASSGEAERRQLTVMFCDLVGSTMLSGQMDPEEYREVLAAYQSAVTREVQRYGGFVARYLGDGLLVYFGYPQAHEDDPERAVRSSLDIVDSISGLSTHEDIELKVRIGIATGLVVAGDILGEGASEERAVLGETPNLAARLQSIAEPNAILISDSTRRLVEGRFSLTTLEPRALKGIAGQVTAYRAVSVREGSRFDAATSRGVTAMTGRDSELTLLLQRWERAKLGEGQIVLLDGEPGIGKSRVTQEVRKHMESAGSLTVIQYQCSPYHTGSAFYPVIDQIQRAASFVRDDSLSARTEKLSAWVRQSLPDVELAEQLLARLLSLPLDAYPPLEMTPQRQKVETVSVLIALLKRLATDKPVLIIFEDAHWVDPSTREMLDAVIDQVSLLKVLCIITYRPEFSPPWTGFGHVTTHSLNRLGRREVRGIAESVSGGKTLPAEVLEQIINKTDGVPLFVEELTKTILETTILEEINGRYLLTGTLPSLSIPATLHDSLIERLDRLENVKEVAQVAACIGREFTTELLGPVSRIEPVALDSALEKLVMAELVFRRQSGELASYIFKHALVQDAAYEGLLLSKRRKIHGRIARVLEEEFPDTASAEPERIAHHYTIAEMTGQAIAYWLVAGRKALSGSSLPEAISHLSKALDLTTRIIDVSDRAESELEVRTVLAAATMALYGWPAPEVRSVVYPACALFERGHGNLDAFVNFWNLWIHHGCRAEHHEGLAVVDRMLTHSSDRDNPVLTLVSSFAASIANFWIGNYESALAHERAALQVYEFERDRNLVHHYNHDPKNTLLSWASLRTWALGYPDKARSLSDEAVAHARKVGHPFNLCWILGNSSLAYAYCGKFDEAHKRVEELRQIAQAQELAFMEAYMAPAVMSVVAAHEGKHLIAYEEGYRSQETWHSVGGRFWSPMIRAYMAQACVYLGRFDEAVELIKETIEQIDSTGELMFAEEIYRIAGLVHLERARDQDGAISFFQKSLDYSKEHGTRSFELRTSMCIARFWHEQGRSQQAHDFLSPIYNSFTEGFDTMYLKEAKALLEDVS